MLSLKYLFPIEERSHKSTALIKRENINISDKISEIQKSSDLNDLDKVLFVNLLNKTRQTIPLLTNANYLETETKNTINELTNRINELTEIFPKDSFPPGLSDEEENKRIEEAIKEGEWGASGTAVEQTIEIPIIPKTKKGLKFDAVAQELKIISDEFFKLRNHNPQYKNAMKEIKDEINQYRSELDDTQELASA